MPTENRSSNTEMVSVKRELVEQAMQACFEAGFGIPHDALRDVLAQPAEQHQGDAIGTLVRDYNERIVFTPIGDPHIIDDMKVYAHADPGEVERLREALKFYADREHYHFESGNWDTVSGEPLNILWCGDEPDFIEDGSVARAALERQS
ncbi:hypothetical protein ACNPNU_05320 [Pseudomonas shirazica]|uniref:hypothetical protein n=1 Tax=Pseudomonas putida group TaxID=136845 RepID=UPI002B24C4BA|nr:hypothetical protein [Pseudomonas putida]